MLRALTANLVAHERIETTDAKAKELRRVAERLITRAIRLGTVAYTAHADLSVADRARRLATERQLSQFLRRFAVIPDGDGTKKVDLVEKVLIDLAKRFATRPGGYTRIIKVGRRRGDNAPMSIIELVGAAEPEKASTGKSKRASKKAQPAAAETTGEAAAATPSE
jgi:large subunit ribosomal protein L17